MSDLISKIKTKISELAALRGQELVDVETHNIAGGKALKIIIGSQAGPTVGDLTSINKAFREACTIDAELKSVDDFSVEVCSPGLDRPLTTPADFNRNLNRFIRVQYMHNEKLEKTEFLLTGFTESELNGTLDNGKPITVTIANIKKAQPAIRF